MADNEFKQLDKKDIKFIENLSFTDFRIPRLAEHKLTAESLMKMFDEKRKIQVYK